MAKRRGNSEGWIKQVDGVWRGSVRLGYVSGKLVRKWVQGSTRTEVQQKLRALVRKKERNEPLDNAKKTVASFMAEWLDVQVKPTRSPSTYRGYEQTSRMYIEPMLGRIPFDRLSGKDVQHMLNQLHDSGLSPASVKNVNATLKSALSRAMKWGMIDRNAAKLATPPKQIKYHPHPLTAEQADRLLQFVANHRYEAMFYLALMMGLRRGEILGVRWSDIDFALGVLRVRQALQRIPRQGVQVQQVKSEKSRRNIPLPPIVMRALLRRQDRQQQERKASGTRWKQDSDFVFTSRDGARLMTEEPTRHLNEALDGAKLPHVRFHDLRHSAASLLLSKGVPMKVIQEIMGHSSFQITADTYSHLVSGELKAAMQTMDDLFSRPRAGGEVADQKGTIQ